MRTLGILFYTAVLVIIGLVLFIFSVVLSFEKMQPQSIQYINDLLTYVTLSQNIRIVIGLTGILLVIISFFLSQLILAKFQREKTIAFPTASGEVTIALSAIEDLIKHFSFMIPQIKEVTPDVIATKRGIIVNLRVSLRSEANLPELTEHLQEITKSKIQEVLGLDEEIIIRIHISKITSREERDRKKREIEKEEPPIPYGGYGRV